MKIILMGYGKMGKEIEAIAVARGHQVVLKIGTKNATEITSEQLQQGDVVIEFSTPHTVIENMRKCFKAHVPVVVGTTGWYNDVEKMSAECSSAKAALFWASNFSLGVNLFFRLNSWLAKVMNTHEQYDVSMEEIHHIHKLDKPSGTAITLANGIIQEIARKKKWSIDSHERDVLHIKDVREGEVPGTHIIKYSSTVDDIEIMHKAHSRKGFALGAVLAAEFLAGKKGIFTMDDLLAQTLPKN